MGILQKTTIEQQQRYFQCFDSLPDSVKRYIWRVASGGFEHFAFNPELGLYGFAVVVAECASVLMACESPIEQLMLFILDVKFKAGLIPGAISLKPQVWVTVCNNKYRGDIVIEFDPLLMLKPLIVECDGHGFHERTKAQARRDKQRQRDLQIEGYHVIRFTGSEIYEDPAVCAEDVVRFIQSLKES